ncbi:hypothetical protein J6590_080393 [Homalodisca vitripennis]|nr:hypothetical protein J6590_080393 [Homalodisca vitripennis]
MATLLMTLTAALLMGLHHSAGSPTEWLDKSDRVRTSVWEDAVFCIRNTYQSIEESIIFILDKSPSPKCSSVLQNIGLAVVETEEIAPSPGELDDLASFLTELLIEDPWEYVGDPLVYIGGEVEEEPEEGTVAMPWKRSRYYRRYPWKRQNGRYNDPDGYICNPSRDDVFQLLVALHEAKNGKERTVHFCNRRRPARAIFTNIRFLGRRK